MPLCDWCDQNAPVVASCGGTDCRLNLCPLDMTETGVCEDCAKEAPIACPPLSSELIAILLSGATIGGARLPRITEDNEHV